jgi:hypothetical protein
VIISDIDYVRATLIKDEMFSALPLTFAHMAMWLGALDFLSGYDNDFAIEKVSFT